MLIEEPPSAELLHAGEIDLSRFRHFHDERTPGQEKARKERKRNEKEKALQQYVRKCPILEKKVEKLHDLLQVPHQPEPSIMGKDAGAQWRLHFRDDDQSIGPKEFLGLTEHSTREIQ